MKLCSVIIIEKDDIGKLLETIKKHEKLTRNFEIIVIYSGSDYEKYRSKVESGANIKLYYQSPSGIYSAMNFGIEKANSKYSIFINSGDCVYNLNLLQILIKTEFEIKLCGWRMNGINRKPKRINYCLPTSHQSIIYRTEILKNNLYNPQYKFAADFEHFLRLLMLGYKPDYVNDVLSENEPYGSNKYMRQVFLEYARITCRYQPWYIIPTVLRFMKNGLINHG